MSVATIEELLVSELQDLYSAEKQITKALPKLVKAATSQELKDAFQSHLEETQGQVERLDQVGEILGKKLTGKTCHGMQGVLEEGNEVVDDTDKGTAVRDAGLITAAQRVEHYEMAGYGGVIAYAKLLGLTDIVGLLEETIEEEKAADKKLSMLSQTINKQAQAEGAGEEESEEDEEE
jgi:ferritin-like metal-binding protein YciE